MSWKISGFGDEISDNLETQLKAIAALGGDALEPRRVALDGSTGKNIVDLDANELQTMRGRLDEYGIACSQIGSPVGKAPLDADMAAQTAQLDGAIRAAQALDAAHIRIFAFQADPALDRAAGLQAAGARLRTLAQHAAAVDPQLGLNLENEDDLYGATPAECAELIAAVDAENFGMCFDPGNFVRAGVRPHSEAWPVLAAHTRMLHVKDCRLGDRAWVPAGQGDGQIAAILADADPDQIQFLSLEPHLASSSWGEGRTQTSLWAEAFGALQALLAEA